MREWWCPIYTLRGLPARAAAHGSGGYNTIAEQQSRNKNNVARPRDKSTVPRRNGTQIPGGPTDASAILQSENLLSTRSAYLIIYSYVGLCIKLQQGLTMKMNKSSSVVESLHVQLLKYKCIKQMYVNMYIRFPCKILTGKIKLTWNFNM